MEKISYALGLSLGNNLLGSGVADLNVAELTTGIQDVLDKKQPKISYQEAQEVINKYFEELQGKAFEKNVSEGKAFLEANGKRGEVVTLKSGLQYEILKEGNGPIPKANNTVKVHYHGTLIDGTVFDSSVERGEPISFPVGGVIAGWTEALQLMPVGSKWELYIPYDLAYGARRAGEKIAPYSTLVFQVELLGIE
jgi:FKBP-type peptidyl-prolyl cis-trans isomerase FklB